MNQKDKVTARVIAHSVSPAGKKVVTWEHEAPRIIHSEFLRHRMFSNSVASSRAIPAKTMRKNIRKKMFIPWYWGKEQAGMQAEGEVGNISKFVLRCSWWLNAQINLSFSWWYSLWGLHKQLANRNTEYLSYIKVVTTATEWDNFFALRDHELAQPEIQELAKKMKVAIDKSKPIKLKYGEWHTPYVNSIRNQAGRLIYFTSSFSQDQWTAEEAKTLSASCVAQTSYRTVDDSLAKAVKITHKLKTANPIHSSPFEAQLTPCSGLSAGVTGFTEDVVPMSGNSIGWVQQRHLLKETK